jgi:anti-sigma regulatory factor (Ser/Thr protein kinase)
VATIGGITLAATVRAPGAARREVRRRLEGRLAGDRLRDAELIVSELVSNAVLHAPHAGVLEVWIRADAGRLRVELSYAGEGPPGTPPPLPPPHAERGRGLLIVDALADRWGACGNGVTCVWFELDVADRGEAG